MLGRLALAIVVGLTAVTCGASGGDGSAQPTNDQQPPGHPNIVFFLTDDQSANQMVALPSVKELHRRPWCDLHERHRSGAAVLSGPGQPAHRAGSAEPRRPLERSGDRRRVRRAGPRATRSLDGFTMPATARHIGKYMNGYGPRSAIPPGWDEWWATSVNPFLMYDYTLNHDGHEEHFGFAPEDYKTDVLTRWPPGSLRDATQGKPALLPAALVHRADAELGPTAGERPKDAPRPAPRHLGRYASATLPPDPSFNEGDVSDKPEWVRALPRSGSSAYEHHGELPQPPGQPGCRRRGDPTVVHAVDAAGELDRTVFVFTSDNGYAQGEHRFPSGKSVVYEPSIRVPFFVTGPGFPSGATVRSPITFADVAPTFARLAGTTRTAPVDGRPLQETIARPNADRAVPVVSGLDTELDSRFEAVRTTRWLYARYPATGESELYDLRRDPHAAAQPAGRSEATRSSSSNGCSRWSRHVAGPRARCPSLGTCRECGTLIGIWHHRGGSSSR